MDFDFNVRQLPRRLPLVPVEAEPTNTDADDRADDETNNQPKVSPELEPYMDDLDEAENQHGSADSNGPHDKWYNRCITYIKEHRKLSIIVAAVVLLCVGGGVSYALTRPNKPAPQAATVKKTAAKPKAVAPAPITSPLTGLVVSADDAKRPTTGVMIENTTFARPQSGLKEAGVVYEAIAEAGITRFLALYQEAKPANIGPVRSARPYYVDWAHSFDAAYGHVGGSPDALAKIKTDGIKDLDQFFNSSYYHRISSREAPHNMYTNMAELDAAKTAKGWTSSGFTSWPRKADAPAKAADITAKSVDVAISGPTYNTHYDYDPTTNSYNRSEGGEPHMDAESKLQLSPKVVIALVIPYSLEADGYHSNYALEGTGTMVVFQDGIATKGTWQRGAGNAQYQFTDEVGHPVKLDAGQTWLTAAASTGDINYKP